MFSAVTIRREMNKLERLKREAQDQYGMKPSEGLAKRIEMLYGAECALSWALNVKGEETKKVSAY